MRRSARVEVFAAVGLAFLALSALVVGGWITSGRAVPTPVGLDDPPRFTKILIRSEEVASPLAALWVLYRVLIRPWRASGRVTADGMFVLALGCSFVWDPIVNHRRTWFLYNAYAVNLGSWADQLPGASSPRGHLLPEPLLIWPAAFVWCVYGLTVVGGAAARRVRLTRPGTSAGGLFALWFAGSFCLVGLAELVMVRTRQFAFAGAIRELSLWPSGLDRYPLYHTAILATVFTALTAVRFSRDSEGRTIFDRGTWRGRDPSLGHRTLAVVGGVAAVWALLFAVPEILLSLGSDPFPSGVPSYLTNQLCDPPGRCP